MNKRIRQAIYQNVYQDVCQPISRLLPLCVLAMLAMLAGCSTTNVTTTAYTPLAQPQAEIAEHLLLDVGVIPLEPGLDQVDEDDPTVLPELRTAESRFMANHIASTIQQSASWGAVRVIPSDSTLMDVYVTGTILHSDGERLALTITVSDSSGATWYNKSYEEIVGKYAYERSTQQRDPFQGLYNRIANDLLQFQQTLAADRPQQLRTISELRFAQQFSPEAYGDHLTTTANGQWQIARLPADNDPMLMRIRRIRERDYLFVDTLQEHYHTFSRRMERPYQQFRSQSYDDIIAVRKLKRDAQNNIIAGAAAVLVGIAAAGGGSGSAQAAGIVGLGAGGILLRQGLGKRQEAQLHIDSLVEMGSSLEAAIEPQMIELEDKTITLSGTVDAQYEQWKAILQQIFEQERGDI